MWSKKIKLLESCANSWEGDKMENGNVNFEDVERIVNKKERQEAISRFYYSQKEKIQKKMFRDALIFSVFGALFGLVGCFDFVAPWIAFPAFVICGLCAAFRFGKWTENVKHWGWL